MTEHQLPASLYVPLRVVLYEAAPGNAVLEYDKPSSLLGQFGDEVVTKVARQLDERLRAVLLEVSQ